MQTSRSILITGASTGIGKACALHLSALGFRTYAGVRRLEDGDALSKEAGEMLVPILLDITNPEAIQAAAE